MMTDTPREPLSAYRLLPAGHEDALTLRFDMDSLIALMRWQMAGSPPGEHPTAFGTEWIGKDGGRRTAFPSGYHGAPVLGRGIAEALRAELLTAGELLPLRVPGVAPGDYLLYLVTAVADCLDPERSTLPGAPGQDLRHAVFRSEAVPAELPAFRVPQFPTGVYWNGWAAARLAGLLDGDVETRLCWSEDPAATPHPNPWLL